MRKVLVIICTGFVPWGGLTTVAMNYYRAMDKDGLSIDFASNNEAPKVLTDELTASGSRYYKLPERRKAFRYALEIYRIIKGYDVVHIHGNSATMTLELFPAVLRDIPERIVHCHTTRPTAKRFSKVLRPFFMKMYTQAVAVSYEAGEWLFGRDNFIVLNNAILVEKYLFREDVRQQARMELGLSGSTVVFGHVGKINIQKNHVFLVEVFYELKKKISDSVLLLVGDGELRGEVEDKADELAVRDSIIFLGMATDVEKWLNAMDCFVFPSNWEGFALAFLEAQANGLKCFGSKSVEIKSDILCTVEILDLADGAAAWAEKISGAAFSRMPMNEVRDSFEKAGMEIRKVADRLRVLYMKEKC